MAAPTDYYVDPQNGNDSTGNGSSGNPWKSCQKALNTITRNATDGDQINVKAGAADVLSASLSLATYGSPTFDAPLCFRGYTTTKGDGGKGQIDGNAGNFTIITNAGTGIFWTDMELSNTGSAVVLIVVQYAAVQRCKVHNSSSDGIKLGDGNNFVLDNEIFDIGGKGINCNGGSCWAELNFLYKSGTHAMTTGIADVSGSSVIQRNILTIDGTTNGIDPFVGSAAPYGGRISGNSILHTGSGIGINISDTAKLNMSVLDNLIEVATGTGIKVLAGTRQQGMTGSNAVFVSGAGTAYNIDTTDLVFNAGDNETLSVTPFAKSGANTYANRFTYFAPVNTGNVRGGAYPGSSNRDKGAVQHADAGGGSGVNRSILPSGASALG